MIALTEIREKTSDIFENEMGHKDLIVPVPPPIWKDKLEAFEDNKLISQKTSLIFDMRCWQAKEMGFFQIDFPEMVEMLMGQKHTNVIEGKDRQNYEWTYNHHDDVLLGNNWGSVPTIFQRITREGFWHLPPFSKKLVWECQFGKLNYLKRVIPYGVVLRMEECKKTKLFNCFNVLAPMEAWVKKTDIDPIVVATIWELSQNDNIMTVGQAAHFFLAQW